MPQTMLKQPDSHLQFVPENRPARERPSVPDNGPTSVCVVVPVTTARPLSGLTASCLKHDGCLVPFQWVALHREQPCKEHVIETLKCPSPLHTSALPPPRRRPPLPLNSSSPGLATTAAFTHTAERRCAQTQAAHNPAAGVWKTGPFSLSRARACVRNSRG